MKKSFSQPTHLGRWSRLLLTAAALSWSGTAAGQERPAPTSAPFDFQGHLLVAVSDADMVPSAYVDGRLAPAAGADALSVIRLNRPPRELHAVALGVSNSVAGPPAAVAVTPDGRHAIVVETLGSRPVGKAEPKLGDLALGRTITVVDLSDPDRPTVIQRVDGPEQPVSVSINAEGSLVAVAYGSRGAAPPTPLTLYRFRDGRLLEPTTPSIPGWTAGDVLSDAEFHPHENTLALLNATRPSLAFVRVTAAGGGGALSLTRWGSPVDVEKAPYLVRFTPDGHHAVVNAMYAEADVLDEGMGAPRGMVSSVRLAADQAADGSPRHRLVSRAVTGVMPEGLAVSPDGRWVATANLERSPAAFDDPRQGFFSSLTLIHLDPQTGGLERVGDFAFDGVLPETVLFDNSSRYLAVTTFARFDDLHAGGSIDFWRLAGDHFEPKRVELIKTSYSVPVVRGAHTMVLVR